MGLILNFICHGLFPVPALVFIPVKEDRQPLFKRKNNHFGKENLSVSTPDNNKTNTNKSDTIQTNLNKEIFFQKGSQKTKELYE